MREIKAVEARKRVLRATKNDEDKNFRWTKRTLMKRIRKAARLGRRSEYKLAGADAAAGISSKGNRNNDYHRLGRTAR